MNQNFYNFVILNNVFTYYKKRRPTNYLSILYLLLYCFFLSNLWHQTMKEDSEKRRKRRRRRGKENGPSKIACTSTGATRWTRWRKMRRGEQVPGPAFIIKWKRRKKASAAAVGRATDGGEGGGNHPGYHQRY